jgi:hypothetical protein
VVKFTRAPVIAVAIALALAGCKHEAKEDTTQPATFAFTVYPGAHYLSQLTELTKQAHKVMTPNQEPPPTAIYDTDAPVDAVAQFYAKAYGFGNVAPAPANDAAAKPPAYYRDGDLRADVEAVEPLMQKMNLKVDASKAAGKYRAAEIDATMNRPRVTIQRPYFDVSTSQVVDRTMILMAR